MKTMVLECPERLHDGVRDLVESGWMRDEQDVVMEALRRFLESHRPKVMESQILQDVEWGLHGDD